MLVLCFLHSTAMSHDHMTAANDTHFVTSTIGEHLWAKATCTSIPALSSHFGIHVTGVLHLTVLQSLSFHQITILFCNNNFYYHSEHCTQCYGA